jgi:hypothetical protein
MGGPERQAISAEEAKKYKYNPFYKTYTESVPETLGEEVDDDPLLSGYANADPNMIEQTFKEVDRTFLAEMAQTKWAKKKGPTHQAASFGSKGKFASDNALADATPWVGDTAPSDYTKSIKGDIEGYLQKWRERHGYSS